MSALFAVDLAPSFMESNGTYLAVVGLLAGIALVAWLVVRNRRR